MTTMHDARQAIVAATAATSQQLVLREAVAAWFTRHSEFTFKTICRVEDFGESVLRALPVAGTVFEAAAGAIREAGTPVGSTVGDVMDVLGMTQKHVNYIACYCSAGGPTTVGAHVALALRHPENANAHYHG